MPEHFNTGIMHSYIKEQLKKRENEYLLIGELIVFVGTWNCAGTPPNQGISEWLNCKDVENPGADVFIVCLQEMCELSAKNILGDEDREESWHKFVIEQFSLTFPLTKYQSVI